MVEGVINGEKVKGVLRLFDEVIPSNSSVTIAYSGGKDSTAVALLFYLWLEERGRSDVNVSLIHNDTLSEIPEMELWAREFSRSYVSALSKLGIHSNIFFLTPSAHETFYWKSIIRGYPAPNFKFRWCTWLFKRKPTVTYLKRNGKDVIMLLGSRDEESSARASSLAKRAFACPLGPARCSAYYLMRSEDVKSKVTPIRDWSVENVWSFLKDMNGRFRLDGLFDLYGGGSLNVRYGCWHCTLVKKQLGHYVLSDAHLYYESARILYKSLTDNKKLRMTKHYGYSRLGALNVIGRAMLYYMIATAEELSNIRLYGLDEAKVEGVSLRDILYRLDPSEASDIIAKVEHNVKRVGYTDPPPTVDELRGISLSREEVKDAFQVLLNTVETYKNDPLIANYLSDLVVHVESKMR